MHQLVISGIRPSFPGLSQSQGQITHVLLTRSPLEHPASWAFPFDLHVLSTPPAFVLSQDQTLHENLSKTTSNSRHLQHNLSQRDKNLTKQKLATPTPQGRCHKNKNHPYPKTLGHTMPNKWHQTIHQHTIEFSKNTHPLIRPILRGVHLRADVQKCCSRLRGNSSSLPGRIPVRKSLRPGPLAGSAMFRNG